MSHIALFQFPWQQMSVQPSRNIHHLGWVRPPWDIRTWEFWKYEKLGKKCSTSIYWTRSTVEKEVYSEISLNFSFRNRREKWFTKSPGTKGGDPSPPNIFKKDISQSSALPLHHFASSAWMKCTNNPIQLQQDDQDFVCCTQRHFTVHNVDKQSPDHLVATRLDYLYISSTGRKGEVTARTMVLSFWRYLED